MNKSYICIFPGLPFPVQAMWKILEVPVAGPSSLAGYAWQTVEMHVVHQYISQKNHPSWLLCPGERLRADPL